MSLPRIGAKMSARAAPAQAPAQRPAASDDQDVPLLWADDQEVSSRSGDDQALPVDELEGDPIEEKAIDDCIEEGCMAEECAEGESVESPREYGRRDEYSGAVGMCQFLSACKDGTPGPATIDAAYRPAGIFST